MRSLMDVYVYVNPFVEPMSLDALARPDPDDSDAITYTIADPGAVCWPSPTPAGSSRGFSTS
jgi:hypothetical protein